MTHFLNHYILKYTPLSPIHIGTGDSYEPTNYIIDDGTLYEFDTGGAMAALTAQDRTELDKITKGKPDTHMLKDVQRFFYSRREALKPWAVNAIPVLDGVANLYASRVGQTANQEKSGEQAINRLEIDRTAYNPITRQPVLFGSSVKGAIRTALLNHLNKKETLPSQDANLFIMENLADHVRKQREREQKKLFPRLNKKLFQFRDGEFELDPMRLVQLSDATWDDKNNLPSSQVIITVNKKKHNVVDENGIEKRSQAEEKNLNKLLECIPYWRYRTFTGQLNLQLVNSLPSSAKTKLPSSSLCFTAQEIAKICSGFYIPILKSEMEEMHNRGFVSGDWYKNIQGLLTKLTDKLMKGDAFLLRVGRHSGAESVTINGVRHIFILKGDPEYQQKTKTLWLAAQHKDQRTDLLPFGWVLVEILPENTADQDWPELAELCAQQQQSALAWAKKQAAQKASLEQKRQEAEQRREREKLEQHQKAEQLAQAEKERLANELAEQQRQAVIEAKRKLMTVEQLLIDDLRNQLQEKTVKKLREQIGGPLYGDLKKIIDQAKIWEAKDKASLKQLGEEILVYLNVKNKKIREILHDLET